MLMSILKNIKNLSVYLSLHFIVGLFMCFLFKCFLFEWNAIGHVKDSMVFLSTIIWLCILLFVIYFIIKAKGLNHKQVFSFLLITGFAVFFLALIMSIFAHSIKLNFFKQEYIATGGYYEEEDGEGNIKTYDKPFYVFHSIDEQIEESRNEIEREYGDVLEMKFVFWQTAYATGYDPKFIKEYSNSEGSQKTVLVITTGLLVLIECLLNSLPLVVFYLTIPFLLFLFKKPFLFKDYNHLKEVIEKQPK